MITFESVRRLKVQRINGFTEFEWQGKEREWWGSHGRRSVEYVRKALDARLGMRG
jgi:hypothetical protein